MEIRIDSFKEDALTAVLYKIKFFNILQIFKKVNGQAYDKTQKFVQFLYEIF